MAVVKASKDAIEVAAKLLRGGALVAFPTETVYGLGADATNGRAVAAIFRAKRRPQFNPLIVHVRDVEAAAELGRLTRLGRQLAAAFWPGALSLVMAKQQDCPVADLATAGLDTVAVRVLPRVAGRPCCAPPIARLRHRARTCRATSFDDGGAWRRTRATRAMILDRRATAVGPESTVVDVTGMRLVGWAASRVGTLGARGTDRRGGGRFLTSRRVAGHAGAALRAGRQAGGSAHARSAAAKRCWLSAVSFQSMRVR
jgi:L-threonylcarbamoyladenylate synthase